MGRDLRFRWDRTENPSTTRSEAKAGRSRRRVAALVDYAADFRDPHSGLLLVPKATTAATIRRRNHGLQVCKLVPYTIRDLEREFYLSTSRPKHSKICKRDLIDDYLVGTAGRSVSRESLQSLHAL